MYFLEDRSRASRLRTRIQRRHCGLETGTESCMLERRGGGYCKRGMREASIAEPNDYRIHVGGMGRSHPWDMVAHLLRRLLSTGGSWVRLPL